jgi:uncharacterized protein (TIGR03435 family)
MAAVFLTLAQGARAQTFEVASVKLADPNAPGTMVAFPNGGTFHATGITANGCILLAYDIQAFQLMGGPSWAGGERYDILAKMPADAAGAPSGPESMQRMKTAVRALLADRFQLAVHKETKALPAYGLVVAKSGFKLKAAVDDSPGGWSSGRGNLKAQRTSLDSFALYLSSILNRPVVDMSGIKGVFDITLEWAPDDADPSSGPSIFAALQEQLGLRLETEKAPVETIVIDRIEKPAGN